MTIAAILLAAGESTRMLRLKQLLPWDGKPLIAWQTRQLRQAGCDAVVVVLGHEPEQIRPAVPDFAEVVVNEDYRKGRATSVRCAAEAIAAMPSRDQVEALVILSVDQPRPAWLTRRLLQQWREQGSLIVSPRFPDGYGHPVVLDASLLDELRQVDDASLGLRAVVDAHLDRASSLSFQNRALNIDLNTPGDYETALASFIKGDWEEDITNSYI